MVARVTRRSTRASSKRTDIVSYDASIVISDPDNESQSEDDFQPAPKKQRKNNKKPKSTHTNSAISNIDDVENYIENPIFQTLSSDDMTPSDLAQTWFDDFISTNMNTKFDALKDFLNFILRSSGCIAQLSRHDVINTDSAKETVDAIQNQFARQKYHEFPMLYTRIGNNKDWKEYPNNALVFVSSIIVISSESGVLYQDDDQLLQLLLEWISAMSTSNIRPLRYTASTFGLTIQSVLCKLSVNITTFIDKFLRQLKRENESLQRLIDNKGSKRNLQRQVESASDRIKIIENNVELYKNQKQIVDDLISDFFNTLFVHRYRDVAHEIRLKCVVSLGEWMEEYPEMFFESSYLRYLGWLLTDQDSNVRSEVFKVLIKLYKRRITVAALRQFTSYFKQKLIEIIIYETDFNARYNCLQLVNEIIEKGYLEDDDHIKLTSLIFVDNEDLVYPATGSKSNAPKFFKEISRMIEKVETAQVSEVIEADDLEYEKLNKILPFDSRKILKVKTLLNVLQDSYEYYLNNYSTSQIKRKLSNSKVSKFERVFQYIYAYKPYNDNNQLFEVLIAYVHFDFTAFDISDASREALELDSKLQYLLLNLINGATRIYTQSSSNEFYKSLFPPVRGLGKPAELDNTYYVSKLVDQLFNICNYFHSDISNIKILLQITINILKFQHENKNIKEIVSQFFRYFTIINFPTFKNSELTVSTYFDSINYQYITFLETVNVGELDLISQIDSVFTELKINLASQVESDKVSVDILNKLYILSHNGTITTSAQDELTAGLKSFSIRFQLHPANLVVVSEVSTFLHISTSYINKSLHRIYQDPSVSSHKNIIETINAIQVSLALSINPDDDTFNIELLNEICVCYLDNLMAIYAFTTEFSHVMGSDDDTVRSLPTFVNDQVFHHILKLWCIREFQYAELLGNQDMIERDEDEDVNFSTYSVVNNSVNEKDYEFFLCEITAKIILVSKLGLIHDELLVPRIARNADSLGDLFKKILRQVDVLFDVTELEQKKNLKQKKITDLMRTRKLIDEDADSEDSDNDDDNDEGGEYSEDPIENSDAEDGNDNDLQHEEDIEFSDLDDTTADENNPVRSGRDAVGTDISSLASSFPFTQEA